MTNKHWTNEEDRVIISQVRLHPTNLTEAFRIVSKKLDRTVPAVSQRYYTHVKLHNKVFMTISSKSASTNTKIGNYILINLTTFWRTILKKIK